MRVVRYSYSDRVSYGQLLDGIVYALEGDVFGERRRGPVVAKLAQVRLLAPVVPGKIVGIGLNYRDHAAELGRPLPASPLFFLKPPTALVGPDDGVICPAPSHLVHHEAELAIVIGRLARNVSEAQAPDFVLGYTCGNDVTARDIQNAEGHNTHAKSFDTFYPLGPVIETDIDTGNLQIGSRVNGQSRQSSNTGNLIFPPSYLVSFLSRIMTLLPGDVISTGTPSGVGPLVPGDVVEVEIQGIGVLRNHVLSP